MLTALVLAAALDSTSFLALRDSCQHGNSLACASSQVALLDPTAVNSSDGPQVETKPEPAPPAGPPSTTRVQVYGGALVSFGSDAGTKATPTARIEVSADVASEGLVPKLRVLADLSALPGDSIDIANPETYKSLEFSVAVSQPLSHRLKFSLYAQGGFASRLPGDPEAVDKAPRWASFGLEFASDRGRLMVGFGPEQRLDTGQNYIPACHVSGIVGLWSNSEGAQVAFAGDAILGLDLTSRFPTLHAARHDVIRAGIMVGWASK